MADLAVTGATGALGGRVVRALADLGIPQRLIVRDAGRAPKLDGGFDCPAPPADAVPAQPLARYAGSYASDFYGPAEILVAGSALKLRIGPQNMTFDLSHWSGDEFLMTPPGESAMPGSRSTVAFADGTMTIEYMNAGDEKGLGVFRSARRPQL